MMKIALDFRQFWGYIMPRPGGRINANLDADNNHSLDSRSASELRNPSALRQPQGMLLLSGASLSTKLPDLLGAGVQGHEYLRGVLPAELVHPAKLAAVLLAYILIAREVQQSLKIIYESFGEKVTGDCLGEKP